MYTSLHVEICFIRVKIVRAPRGARLISTSPEVLIYRRRPVPVKYVTTRGKTVKNRPVPGRFSNLSVIRKSLKSYGDSFICDHNIKMHTM